MPRRGNKICNGWTGGFTYMIDLQPQTQHGMWCNMEWEYVRTGRSCYCDLLFGSKRGMKGPFGMPNVQKQQMLLAFAEKSVTRWMKWTMLFMC